MHVFSLCRIILLIWFYRLKADECPPGMVWTECGPVANTTCDNPFPVSLEECIERCQCPKHTPVQHVSNGQISCETRKKCCVGDRIWGCRPTPTSCHPWCPTNPEIPRFCTEECAIGCQCGQNKSIEIFDQDHKLVCISVDQCPICKGGQVYVKCGSTCTKTCAFPEPRCQPDCVSKCECPPDRPIWHNDSCITKELCPVRDICEQQPPTGFCSAKLPRWTYLSGLGECRQILHPGCDFSLQDTNLFLSRVDCYKACNKSGCPFVDCGESFCPSGFKVSDGCPSGACECVCPCEKIICGPGELCIPHEASSTCDQPPCLPQAQCQVKRCEKGVVVSSEMCGEGPDKLDCFDCKQSLFNHMDCCTEDICHLPPDSGCGVNNDKRWFFDFENQQCHKFRYGGSAGNANNFRNKKSCRKACLKKKCKEQRCNMVCEAGYKHDENGCKICQCYNPCEGRVCGVSKRVSWRVVPCFVPPCPLMCGCDIIKPHICHLPVAIGNCGALIRRYTFDGEKCRTFTYTGCGGNANNFATFDECLYKCGYSDQKCRSPPQDCSKICPHGFKNDMHGCLTCQCKDPCFGKMCSKKEVCQVLPFHCINTPCPNVTAMCVDKLCKVGSPLQDVDQSIYKCTKRTPCPSGYKCKARVCCTFDECMLPPDSGPCPDYFQRYYFDRLTGKCEMFVYSGCGGNDNRFRTLSRCQVKCMSHIKPSRR